MGKDEAYYMASVNARIADDQNKYLREAVEIFESMRGECECDIHGHHCGWPRIERWLETVKHRLPKEGDNAD